MAGPPNVFGGPISSTEDVVSETLAAGATTLSDNSANFYLLTADAGGNAILLPPAAPNEGRVITIRKVGGGTLTVEGEAIATGSIIEFYSDGASWNVLGKPGATRIALVAGGAAGDHTVTGIAPGDELISVLEQDGATGILTDLTGEFSITGADTINNGGGTDTDGDQLLITYADQT